MAYATVNPYTNEVVKEYPNATASEIQKALENGNDLFKRWEKEQPTHRAEQLHEIAKLFRQNRDYLAKAMVTDMGKLYREAQGEVDLCAMIADYFADHGADLLAPTKIETVATGDAQIQKHPLGVLMMVEPWNFPMYQIMRVFAPNFMVGNPMILKHASNTPGSAVAFENMIKQSSAPDASLQNLFLSYDQVAEIIADSRVQGVALTGSERGGRSVAKTAGENLKKNTMELGGTDAFIVLDDADIDSVTDIAWRARLYNAGQVCTSSKRFIVAANLYDKFLAKLKENFANVKPGDPMDSQTTLAPMNSKRAKDKLQAQVDDAIAKGATLYYGNEKIDLPGQFFQPTILTNVQKDNPAYAQEMFGPVAQVYKVNSDQEAIDLANDSDLGLGGIVFSGDPKRGTKVASQIETGMVFVNNFMVSLPDLPFGGVKNSGYGREMSSLGLNAFVNEQLIVTTDKPNMNNLAGGLVATDPK
ncbi:Succinate-semialdehyde dehydrogenase [NAD] [Pediococcus damnosus]|uniref:Succinate-semialdehyde dehydrogenase [NAD] n=1 Tax=Pediococcus damnosus TaxID=51663 RepID=A0A0R2H438_9LACO|nr:NAD-dependent succinate-semialdehyde dehydrogenase [Pediococcus damnosus]AMV61940.1 Succinate-semialdehyde dehydrogenase [NAD] [Pediococcus damnosus]AMV66181.1 Succinate-semialdehyde dehydrogenase [NAD] [Pediococcus damnosus]AMV68465.1 Succinate-semialdehyde dehydrogenase [NAD] [Pediococcus damnosus]KJU74341.1 succinate-semialdehyde dehydrogenase [Pediococcus damnosus LMG 28219]KRN47673.1 NAD-dependent aldehyde dehydrogenase [Pediococcus damnosus]